MKLTEILQDPTRVFDSPCDVLAAKALSREEKIKVLHQWEDDANQLQTAEGEGMETQDNSTGETLQEVLAALKSLGAKSGIE